MSQIFGLIGTGGHGREMMPVARQMLGESALIYFVQTTPEQEKVNGIRVISEADFLAMPGEKIYSIAIGNPTVRAAVAKRLQDQAHAYELIHRQCHLGDANRFGEGLMLSAFTAIGSNVTIGRHFQANVFCSVAHDCVIGDFVTFGPNVQCNGNVHIGDGVTVGSGAVIRNGTPDAPLTIGAGAIIGMGAVVTKSVAAGSTVWGNPARLMETE